MTASSSSIGKTTGSQGVQGAAPQFGPDIALMSPDDVIAYVTRALGDIGNQLNDYKDMVKQRQEKATELRDLLGELRGMSPNDNDLVGYDQEKYDGLMSRLAKYKDDPQLGQVYENFMNSFGGYRDTATGQQVGILASDDSNFAGNKNGVSKAPKDAFVVSKDMLGKDIKVDKNANNTKDGLPLGNGPSAKVVVIDERDAKLTKFEINTAIEQVKGAMEGLNSDSELTMMSLQQLMQQRNQISQFSTNMLSTLNDSMRSVIANIGK